MILDADDLTSRPFSLSRHNDGNFAIITIQI